LVGLRLTIVDELHISTSNWGDTLADDVIFELRTDATTGRKVLIAEGRALRPNDFVDAAPLPALDHSANCPFCRGNEFHTPHELAVVNDAMGNWQVRVVPNKYPALASIANAQGLQSLGVFGERAAASGIHEVVIESPRHVRDWSDLATDDLAAVLRMFRDRIEHAYTMHQMQSALVFKNVGQAAGASLEHIHTQLVAFPYVPEVLEREVQIAAEHHHRTGSCLMCQLLGEEQQTGTRLVCENDSFAAFTAFAGRQPYETWVVPKQHACCFTQLGNEESHSLAIILRDLVELLSHAADLRPPVAYNVVLHTAPVGDERSVAFHWHWELIPRTTSLAGFEWGTGMYINSISPERAAIRMRMSKSGGILPIQ
jgi:UDPglucose--hexose-1-phosphate uridylyltransferase